MGRYKNSTVEYPPDISGTNSQLHGHSPAGLYNKGWKMTFDNYRSHLSVFEKIHGTFNINRVLEFGLGEYSTPFFVEHCGFVVSIEQESREWYDKIKAKINSLNWHPVFQRDPEAVFQYFNNKDAAFDLVFSDGLAQTRCLVANQAMQRNVPLVVLHDTEKIWYYRWNLLDIPSGYSRFDFRCRTGVHKVTTVLTNHDANIIDQWSIPEHDRILQAYSSPCQPIVQIVYNNTNTPPRVTV